MTDTIRRGHIYKIAIGEVVVHGLVVSINAHNARSDEVVIVRVTTSTTGQEGLPGSVRLNAGDPLPGYVVCRDVGMVATDEVVQDLGLLGSSTMVAVENALRQVLGL